MQLWSSPLVFCSLIFLIGMHAAAVFLPEKIGKILQYVNILLHILYLAPLLYAHIPMDEAVLSYMISVFFYTVFFAVRRKCDLRRDKETADAEENV